MPRIIPPLVSRMVEEASASAGSDVVPFWNSDSEGTSERGMYELASWLDTEDAKPLLGQFPPGYRIVHSIFEWEMDRAGEGFKTGTDNAGEAAVRSAADSYEEVGMSEEANALRRMLAQYLATPDDYEKIEAAYHAAPNPWKEDWDRIPALVRHLCANADRYFYVDA